MIQRYSWTDHMKKKRKKIKKYSEFSNHICLTSNISNTAEWLRTAVIMKHCIFNMKNMNMKWYSQNRTEIRYISICVIDLEHQDEFKSKIEMK